jgi:hypothetical protein
MESSDIARFVAKLGFSSVRLSSTGRPMLLKAVLQAGVRALRPGADTAATSEMILRQLVEDAVGLVGPHPEEMVRLRRQVDELQRRSSQAAADFSTDEVLYIRVCHEYGMTLAQLAKLYDVDVRSIARACGKKLRGLTRRRHTERARFLGSSGAEAFQIGQASA